MSQIHIQCLQRLRFSFGITFSEAFNTLVTLELSPLRTVKKKKIEGKEKKKSSL